ncbi:hypothetical protein BLOT_000110 [Blomia tropicalis]|nr:hypothetical protein BLOT_000110 [Blomia tropicalis]
MGLTILFSRKSIPTVEINFELNIPSVVVIWTIFIHFVRSKVNLNTVTVTTTNQWTKDDDQEQKEVQNQPKCYIRRLLYKGELINNEVTKSQEMPL